MSGQGENPTELEIKDQPVIHRPTGGRHTRFILPQPVNLLILGAVQRAALMYLKGLRHGDPALKKKEGPKAVSITRWSKRACRGIHIETTTTILPQPIMRGG